MFPVQFTRRWIFLAVVLVFGAAITVFGVIPPAQALSLDEAKAQGLIGEQPNGYVGVVPGGNNPAAASLTAQINAKRRAAYQNIAKRNATTLQSVEVVAGGKLVGRVKSGQWYMDAAGKWHRR
ncbi:MAG: YdbL family protein [Alphaproteobacteria bacterium]|jgi:uncharacterized protein|nr:YdbL family protein [Alphaproteobacteria bacterium]